MITRIYKLPKDNYTGNLYNHAHNTCLLVWRDMVILRRLALDPVVMCSSPATGHERCRLLVNHPIYVLNLLFLAVPNALKLADVVLIFKKNDMLNKMNYRPISIL